MEQPKNELGTRKDLVMYRLQTSKDALNSARILFEAKEYKGLIIVPIMLFFMLLMHTCFKWKSI